MANRRLAIPVLARSRDRTHVTNSCGSRACSDLVAGRARDFFEAIDRYIGCTLLALLAFSVFVAPSNMATTLVAGAYFGSIVFAVLRIFSRRKDKKHRAEFDLLREDVKRLLDAEHRRILKKVTTSKQKPD